MPRNSLARRNVLGFDDLPVAPAFRGFALSPIRMDNGMLDTGMAVDIEAGCVRDICIAMESAGDQLCMRMRFAQFVALP